MTLEKYINENITKNKDSIFYNEEFCNLVLNYIGSYVGGIEDFKQIDIQFLEDNGYDPIDFFEYE